MELMRVRLTHPDAGTVYINPTHVLIVNELSNGVTRIELVTEYALQTKTPIATVVTEWNEAMQ